MCKIMYYYNLNINIYTVEKKKGNSNPLQYPCLENSMDRGAWRATVHGITKCCPRLSN